MATANSRRSLRHQQRQQRRNLTGSQRRDAERRVARAIVRHPWFVRARHIAFYMAFDGEIDLTAVATAARSINKRLYLPRIDRRRSPTMGFVAADVNNPFAQNHLGIDEPADGHEIDPRQLDLVLAPLVAFDSNGTRLGMGGGYYDRSFSFLRWRRHWRHPKMLGVGFASQRVDYLPREPWDVPLHGAVTEAVTLSFSTAGER